MASYLPFEVKTITLVGSTDSNAFLLSEGSTFIVIFLQRKLCEDLV